MTFPTLIRRDPSQTAIIRRKQTAEMRQRFINLRKAIKKMVITGDCFGLTWGFPFAAYEDLEPFDVPFAVSKQFQGQTRAEKSDNFRKWLERIVAAWLLWPRDRQGNNWTAEQVSLGYWHGLKQAYTQVSPLSVSFGSPYSVAGFRIWLQNQQHAPKTIDSLRSLNARVYGGLEAIAADLENKGALAATDGLATGKSANQIYNTIDAEIRRIYENRAAKLADTEIVRASAEGQLDGFESLGVKQVGMLVEFKTSGLGNVCPICQSLAGTTYTIQQARGIIPVHAACACGWVVIKSNDTRKRGVWDFLFREV